MAAINIGSLSDVEKTYHIREALEFAKPKLAHKQFGLKERVPAREGKVAQWIRFDKFAITSGSDFTGSATYVKNTTGAAPTWTPETPTDTTVTAQLDALFGKGLEWNEAVEYTALINLPKEFRKLVTQHAAEVMDVETRDVITATTNRYFANGKTQRQQLISTDTVDLDDLIDVVVGLRSNDAIAQDNDMFPTIISPHTEGRLMKNADFRTAVQFQKNYMFTGQIVDLLGLSFIRTSLAKTVSNAGSNNSVSTIDITMVIGAMSYGVTTWLLNDYDIIYTAPGGHGDEWKVKNKLAWKMYYKAVILNNSWIAALEHAR